MFHVEQTLNFKPLSDLIIVQPDEPVTKIGLIELAPSAQEEAKQGTAVAVGPGKEHKGWLEPMTVKVGTRVLYSKYAKETFKSDGREYLILHEADVISIID